MSLKRASTHRMRELAARLPFKVPFPTNPKLAIALVVLVIIWTVGPKTVDAPRGDGLGTLERLTRLPLPKLRPSTKNRLSAIEQQQRDSLVTPPDLVLDPEDAEIFCSHYHLQRHNASAWMPPTRKPTQRRPSQRRIYDLLLVTPTTSADMIELRLASLYPYVDYFVLLEAPPPPPPADYDDPRSDIQGGPPVHRRALDQSADVSQKQQQQQQQQDTPSLLEKIWHTQLRAFHPKLIRHSLSQHSHDYKSGLDWTATTRNALYTRVIPLLNGQRKVQLGDVLLVSDPEELVRPIAMKVLRNCDIPDRTTITTRKYWYSFQWMQIDSPGVTRSFDHQPKWPDREERPEDKARRIAAASRKRPAAGNEWWPHPQATVYRGADTVFPDDLRRNRRQDQYVFGDGGWTCHLCYPTITETLYKLGSEDVIWFDGPRWKAAGRVVDRAMNGVELVSRDNLSRIDDNTDLPPRLKSDAKQFKYMLDRDPLGANFADFNPADYRRYLTKKKDVEYEPDFETTGLDEQMSEFSAAGGGGGGDESRVYRGPEDNDLMAPPTQEWRDFGYQPNEGGEGSENPGRNLLEELEDLNGITGWD